MTGPGFQFHRQVIDRAEVDELRQEADRIAMEAGSANVRRLTSRSKRMAVLAQSPELTTLLPPGLELVRSILFDKTPAENWPVGWHQDLTIEVDREDASLPGYGPWLRKEDAVVHVQPPVEPLRGMVTLRLHLDETSAANGALRVIPGSHQQGKIPSGDVSRHANPEVICECGPGDVLAMSPLILHASRRSQQPGRRRVIHLEYARRADPHSRLRWAE